MNQAYTYRFLGQDLLLLPERAIFWKEQKAILAADLHFGKVGHFRKEGIPLPHEGQYDDYNIITGLIQKYEAERLFILGDLFHSEYNNEINLFKKWKDEHPNVEVVLIKGNHDILSEDFYTQLSITVVNETMKYPPFILSHKTLKKNPEKKLYNLAGHIHPAVELKGLGRQQLTLACFYFGKEYGLLPACGKFTGKCKIQTKKGDEVFVILEDKVCKI